MKMKINRLVNSTMYSKSVKALTALFILAGSFSVQAQKAADVKSAFPNTEVRHLGNVGSSMMFQIKLDNSKGDRFSIVLKDKDGSLLFHSTYNDKKFDKKYKIDKPQTAGVVFYIKNFSDNSVEAYEINTNTKVIEEVSVTRITR